MSLRGMWVGHHRGSFKVFLSEASVTQFHAKCYQGANEMSSHNLVGFLDNRTRLFSRKCSSDSYSLRETYFQNISGKPVHHTHLCSHVHFVCMYMYKLPHTWEHYILITLWWPCNRVHIEEISQTVALGNQPRKCWQLDCDLWHGCLWILQHSVPATHILFPFLKKNAMVSVSSFV